MADGYKFAPLNVRAVYQNDGSAKSSFLAEVARMTGDAQKRFEQTFDQVGRIIDNTASKFNRGKFSLDLDLAGLRNATAEADHAAIKVTALRDAAIKLALATNDTSKTTKTFIDALRAQTVEAERARSASYEQLQTYGRLQDAVTKLTRDNHALAQSYRDTFLEQAKAENAAYRSQRAVNATAAPGLDPTRSASRNGAPSSASNSAFLDQSYAPKVDPRTGLEAFLAGKGAVDSAVMSVATLEQALGRVQKKGPEVAAALAEVERAAANAANERATAEAEALALSEKAKAEAASELQRLAQAADRLNASLNPAVAVQQRFNNEVEHARTLLKAGVIDQNLYAQAVQKATADQASSLKLLADAQDQQTRAAKRGTSETQNVINSTRSLRVAGIQAGQQIQDMAIQFQMGTNATTVFAQQIPQLAFALSGLEGNTNKTLSKVGQFSTFLAGPWGAAILIAGVALVPLIDNILGTGDAADDAKGKTYDFSNGLNVLTLSANNAAAAMAQLADEMRSAIAVQGDFLRGKANIAQQSVKELQSLYDKEGRELAALEKRTTSLNPFNRLSPTEMYRLGALKQNRKPLGEALTNAQNSAINANIAVSQQRGLEAADPRAAANGRYNRAVGDLNKRFEKSQRDPIGASAAGTYITQAQFETEFAGLTKKKDAEIDALKKTRAKKGADPAKEAERAARAAMRLGEFGEDAGKKIANIADSFRDIPPEVERVNKASRELDDIINDLMNRKPEGFKELVDQAQGLKEALPDMAFGRVMRQITEDAQQQVAVQTLILQGREGEADALRQIYQIEQNLGPLRADQKQDIIDTSVAMQRINEEMQRAQELQQVFLESTRNVRGEVEAILGGYGKVSDLGATLKRSFQQIQGKILTEQIFGDVFRDMDKWVKEKTGIGSSVDMMAKETERAGGAAARLADELSGAAQRIAGIGGGSGYAGIVAGNSAATAWGNMKIPDALRLPGYDKDPNAPIVVVAEKAKEARGRKTVNDLRPDDYFSRLYTGMGDALSKSLNQAFGTQFFSGLSNALGGALAGYGVTGSPIGAAAGAVAGQVFGPEALAAISGPFAAAVQVNKMIGDVFGFEGGPLGVLGAIFKSTKKGYAVINNGGVSTGGNSTQAANAGSAGSSVQENLQSIASAFGSSLGNYAVSIGSRSSGWVSVSGSGSSMVGDKGWKKNNAGGDLLYDGKDMEEALRVALKNAIEDGAIQGIRAGSKRLLSIGANIDAQVEKALKFENVFKTLKAIKDPVGAALDELNTEFTGLIDIFKQAGASAEEMGQLEELYGIKRADSIKAASEALTSSLRSLKEELTIGSDYLSLRDRKSAALEIYNPLKARVASGDTTAFDAFSDAARSLISIEREISGSTSPFYSLLKEVTDLTNGALNGQDAKIAAATSSDSPFSALAAQNAATTSAIDSQTLQLMGALGAVNDNLVAVVRQLVANGSASSADVSTALAARGYF